MKRRITRIAPLQLGKLLAAAYALFSVIFVPFLLIGALASSKGKGLDLALCVLLPLLYIVFGFIGGIVGAFVYNVSAKYVGGIELEFDAPISRSGLEGSNHPGF